MCFGGSKKTETPQPEPAARFDYNVSQPQEQQKKVAIAQSLEPNQQAGQTLGGAPATPATY